MLGAGKAEVKNWFLMLSTDIVIIWFVSPRSTHSELHHQHRDSKTINPSARSPPTTPLLPHMSPTCRHNHLRQSHVSPGERSHTSLSLTCSRLRWFTMILRMIMSPDTAHHLQVTRLQTYLFYWPWLHNNYLARHRSQENCYKQHSGLRWWVCVVKVN